eukprot:Seg6924.1 transcript_id=Seg6924.1/GoldUCD/mRNA.D3Y31 product="Serine/threonine-protein kinase EDR1" protein_id=Seg6924.1/GoldUCD/D3Y31
MEFKFPLPKCPVKRSIPECLLEKEFKWSDLSDKDVLGEGAFGTVMTAHFKGKTVVIKKLLDQQSEGRRLFIKEAKFLQQLQSNHVARFLGICEKPMAIMMEYVFFCFSPFGLEKQVSSLKDFLDVLHEDFDLVGFENMPVFIGKELANAVNYLHLHGIAHRDLKTLNVLVCNNHYVGFDDVNANMHIIEADPVHCKLVDFGESRSNQNQTRSILHTRTNDIGRGTLLFMAPERLLGKICAANQEDLYAADIWSLGMVYFCISNPELSFPFQLELKTNPNLEQFLKQQMGMQKLPSVGGTYMEFRSKSWQLLCEIKDLCLKFDPEDRPKSSELLVLFERQDCGGRETADYPEENAALLTGETQHEAIDGNNAITSEFGKSYASDFDFEQGIIRKLQSDLDHQQSFARTNDSETHGMTGTNKHKGQNATISSAGIHQELTCFNESPSPSKNPQEYYRNFPVFEVGRKTTYTPEEAAKILLSPNIDPKIICEAVPPRVQNNLAFIVNLNALSSQGDITADDNGSYKSGQGRPNYIYFNSYDDVVDNIQASTVNRDAQAGEEKFILTKYNGICTSSQDFHRCILRLKRHESLRYYQYAILQYTFDETEHEFEVSSHGNSRKGLPYKQTAQSIRESIKEAVAFSKPTNAMKDVRRNEGGYLSSSSLAMLPRNIKQAENFKFNNHRSKIAKSGNTFGDAKDTLADMMLQCKMTMNNPQKAFIWRVECAPEPMCIIGTENCFRDVERFCCNAPQGLHSTLTIDPTFDLGEFAFTPTTYRNLALVDQKTGENKLQMGPALIHYRKRFTTYHYFTTALVGIRPKLSHLRSFGTDGETPLVSACEKTWPFADGLRCFIHSKRNVKSHLVSYLPTDVADAFIDEIYGKKTGAHHQEGLCDSRDKETFEAILSSLEEKWNEMEMPYRGASCKQPMFHQWFSCNIANYMREGMLKEIRERNGIPGIFSTNASESINAALKRKLNYQASGLTEFLSQMKEFYADQEEIIRSSFIGESDVQLSASFEEFQSGEEYILLDKEKKLSFEKAFYNQEVGEVCKVQACRVKGNQQNSILDGHLQIPGLTLKHSFFLLEKASQIMTKGHIMPSFGTGCFHVIGSSQDAAPHFVKRTGAGEFKCDPDDPRNGCLAFKKDKICAHVVAAAKHAGEYQCLIQKFATKKGQNNITDLVLHEIAPGKGKKAGPGRKRRLNVVETITEAQEVINPPLKVKILKQNGIHIAVQPRSKDFLVTFLDDHPRVVVCAGCGVKFPRLVNGKPYSAPNNLILSHLEQGSKRLPNGVLKVFEKKSCIYYHPNLQCVRRGNNAENVGFSGSDIDFQSVVHRLEDAHRELLRKNFQLNM